MEKKLYNINIAGLPLKLRSGHSQEVVDQLANIVSEKIEEAQKSGKQVSFQNALLLASLHLAEELMSVKDSVNKDLNFLKSKSRSILSDLESSSISKIGIENKL